MKKIERDAERIAARFEKKIQFGVMVALMEMARLYKAKASDVARAHSWGAAARQIDILGEDEEMLP